MNTSATTRPAKKPWTTGEKFLLGAILALVVLVATGGLWWGYVNAVPAVTIPTPAMPSPNAYDYFVAAGNAVVDGDKIGYAIEAPTSPHTNQGPDHAYTPSEQAALVQENAGALRTLRQGFAFPFQAPPARSFTATFPYYGKFRGLARLLRLQGQVAEARGDWAGAVGSQLDATELGVKMPRGGPLIGMLVGIACQAIGRRPVWVEANHLSAAQAKTAARRLETLSAEQVPYADVLQEEKWGTQAGLMELFRRPDWVSGFLGSTGMSDGNMAGEAAERFRMRMTPKRTVLDHFTGYMDRLIADARQPYVAQRPAPATPNDPVSAVLCPVFTGADLKYTDTQAQDALLLATLALRAYRLEHGKYPATLTALVPAYLSHIPDDPFALSGPLRYRAQGTTYVLYSVGPDGRDDGGSPILDTSRPTAPGASNDQRLFVRPDSQGDIAAGVNVF